MLFQGGFNFVNFLVDVIVVFAFVMWFWLMITVIADLFRRSEMSGWRKAIWVIFLFLSPYIGVLIYLILNSHGMAERNYQRVQQSRDEIRQIAGFRISRA